MYGMMKELPEVSINWWRYYVALMRASNREIAEFTDSYLIAAQIAMLAAKENPMSLVETQEIVQHAQAMISKAMMGASEKMTDFAFDQAQEALQALVNTVYSTEGENVAGFMRREAEIMEAVANFHEQIEKIKDEFGFQFDRTSEYKLFCETDNFLVYQVMPLKK